MLLSSETTAKGTGLEKSAGKEDPVDRNQQLTGSTVVRRATSRAVPRIAEGDEDNALCPFTVITRQHHSRQHNLVRGRSSGLISW